LSANANADEKLLSDLLEKIIFNENDLNEFQNVITNVISGKIHPRLLKEQIIICRIRILEEIKDLFPFYMNQIVKKQSIDQFVENNQGSDLIKELKEKNEFLTDIAITINSIHEKLKSS
jgi:hypothetical protein